MKKEKLHIKNTGFITPKNYFEAIENKLLQTTVLDKKVSNKNPFTTPETYFEEVTGKILTQTSTENKESKIISIFRNKPLRYAISIAAMFLLVISIFKFQQAEENITDMIVISEYIENGFLDISDIDLEAFLTDEMLDNSFILSEISPEEILEYLMYNIDETTLIYD